MAKHDNKISSESIDGSGARVIAKRLGLNPGYVSKRLKALGLTTNKVNQHSTCNDVLEIKFEVAKDQLRYAAEDYLKFLLVFNGYIYADVPPRHQFDLLADFGDGWKMIQVKTSTRKIRGNFAFDLARTRHNSTSSRKTIYDNIDYFFLMSLDRRAWLVPLEIVGDRKQIIPATIVPGFEIIGT